MGVAIGWDVLEEASPEGLVPVWTPLGPMDVSLLTALVLELLPLTLGPILGPMALGPVAVPLGPAPLGIEPPASRLVLGPLTLFGPVAVLLKGLAPEEVPEPTGEPTPVLFPAPTVVFVVSPVLVESLLLTLVWVVLMPTRMAD